MCRRFLKYLYINECAQVDDAWQQGLLTEVNGLLYMAFGVKCQRDKRCNYRIKLLTVFEKESFVTPFTHKQ